MSAVSMRFRSSWVLFVVESEDLVKSQGKDLNTSVRVSVVSVDFMKLC